MAEEEKKQEPKVEEFMEIGGSPVPGITLRQVLRGHKEIITGFEWSPNGQFLGLPYFRTKAIFIQDVNSGEQKEIPHDRNISKFIVSWSPTEQAFASLSADGIVQIWDVKNWKLYTTFTAQSSRTKSLTWSPNGRFLAFLSNKNSIGIWDLELNKQTDILLKNRNEIDVIAWSPNGQYISSGDHEGKIQVWDTKTWKIISEITGHSKRVNDVLWFSDSQQLLSASIDKTIKVLNVKSGAQKVLEGHTNGVWSISLSADELLLASGSWDNTCKIWSTDGWICLGTFPLIKASDFAHVAFHPVLPILATIAEESMAIHIWDINSEILVGGNTASKAIQYTTAKLVLVGDSGVGKTGLGWRLAHNEFKEHSSTHGQQFWAVPELKKTRDDGTECEAVLWDLAGQHIYRSIHSIFLDDVDASLVLFDPTNRQEPLKGAQFWLEQLKGKKQLPPSVLVGARLDRGAPVLSQQELDQFCQKYGVSGGYIGTSAKSGEGLDTLLETLKEQIPWDQMTTTVTTVTFKRIKEYVLSLKEKTDRKGVLVHPAELRMQLEATDKDWKFTDAEMMTAVGHLANHGYVTILKSSSGDEYILLVPELLASVASSIFLHADKHPRELGAINETELLQGKYPIDEFKGLVEEEQHVLLDATVVRFLEHSLCFREALGSDNLLIFPSLIKQKRPLKDEVPATDDISYIVRGRVENIYASLVVLLGYTSSFTRINQWANQAQYETEDGDICGFRLVEDREGEIELIIYYYNEMEKEERDDFQGLFEQFLYKHEVEVTPFPPVICSNGHRQERATVVKRLKEGKKFVFCEECAARVDLPDLEAQSTLGFEVPDWLQHEEALARLRNTYESHLVNVKGYRRDWATPRCYISHVDEQNEFANKLSHDLAAAGVFIIENVSEVEADDSIIIIDSKVYKESWEKDNLLDDVKLIKSRLIDGKRKGLITINQSGSNFLHLITHCASDTFCDPTHYVINLFDLILKLYTIPLSHAGFIPLRQTLHTQWEQTLAQNVNLESLVKHDVFTLAINKEVFISYAWKGESEIIVNEIDQSFQRRGVKIIRDKRDLNYKGSIKEFMERIGRGQAIAVVISDKYLKSKNCMFELIQIAENKQFKDRIFPVVLSDADIYDPVKRIEYIKYWEVKKKELDTAIKSVSSENLQGIRDDMDLYDTIRDEIAGLVDILQDMNTFTPDMHRDSDFQTLYDAVIAKLEE